MNEQTVAEKKNHDLKSTNWSTAAEAVSTMVTNCQATILTTNGHGFSG